MATKKRPLTTEETPTVVEGYPEEIFLDISDDEKDDLQCSICLQIVRQPVFCQNVHFFCRSCLNRWNDTPKNLDLFDQSFDDVQPQQQPVGTDCPVCRVTGLFCEDTEMAKLIDEKEVMCIEVGCKWTGDLIDYDEHVTSKHILKEPSSRKLRSSASTTGQRVTYHY